MTRTEQREPALRIRNLRKSFATHLSLGHVPVLAGLNLEVSCGEIYGLLGPNGAGKTTTLKLVLGLLRPDAGEITLLGRSASDPESRRKVGFLPENPYFYDYLTAREFLDFYGRLMGIPRAERGASIDRLLARVGLEKAPDKPLRKFSKGMVQRVGMAQALLGDPDFVVLDEPMSGLDPIGRREFRDIIVSLRESGKTVFFSSHILQDAEMICDRVGIMNHGTLVREGDLSTLLSGQARSFEVTLVGSAVPQGSDWRVIQRRGGETLLHVEDPDALDRLIRALPATDARLVAVSPIRLSLEDLFLREVQGPARSETKNLAASGKDR